VARFIHFVVVGVVFVVGVIWSCSPQPVVVYFIIWKIHAAQNK
jgi:hypothetical protein